MADEWTLLALKEHLEKLIAAETVLRKARREDDLLALQKAENALGKRLDSMNEIRDQLREQASTFLPRETYDTAIGDWQAWRHQVDNYMASNAGRSQGISATGRLIVTAITVGTGLIIVAIALANYLTSG